MNQQEFRAFVRTKVPVLAWGYRHFLTAVCEGAPDDCSSIPKVDGAGDVVPAQRRRSLPSNA